jgi:pyruvate formate lyase activating enzyme
MGLRKPPLIIAGLQKTSLIDFPGMVSCVVFLTGCNFRCPYCHNPDLALGRYPMRLSPAALIDLIGQRRTLLDGIVISGGEPTLWPQLPELFMQFRQLGFAVKLDTNGSRPEMVTALIRDRLVDYIAMDLKSAPEDYGPPWAPEGAGGAVQQSIDAVMSSGVDYEFRATCAPGFVDAARIEAMAMAIRGARRFILQKFNPTTVLDPEYGRSAAADNGQITALAQLAAPFVQSCTIRSAEQ